MGHYYEARAPQGAPVDGEKDVWLDGGEVKLGHWDALLGEWIVDKTISSEYQHESRLIPEEDEDIHVDVNVLPPEPDGSYGRIGVAGKPTSQYGFDEGTPYKGVIPVTCLRVGKAMVDSQGQASTAGITESDGLKINLSYGLLTRRLGKPFVFANATFYTYDEANDDWDTINAQKLAVIQKLFAGVTQSDHTGAQLWVKGADPGEYITIGVVQS